MPAPDTSISEPASREQAWRQQYFELLRQLETREGEWTRLRNVLRLLIGRLTLAAQGREPHLDDELERLSQALRRQAEVAELESTLESLSRAIATLDRATPRAARGHDASALQRTGAAVALALERLGQIAELQASVAELLDAARAATGIDDIVPILDSATRIVVEQRARLEQERLETEHLLQQVMSRLDEIAQHILGESAQQDVRRESVDTLHRLVSDEMQALDAQAQRADSLGELREQVRRRLDAISSYLQDFRRREEDMHRSYQERTERLRARVTQLERQSETLQRSLQEEQRLAMLDALTSIANRAAYDYRIQQEFRRWKRFGGELSILAWDIDHFKAINDAYGHKAGDKVLRVIGQHLARQVRETDFVARYGGEEFVMVLIGTAAREAREIAEKIRLEIAQLGFHFHSTPVTVTASCGITSVVTGDTPNRAFDRADRALYEAKKAGRNCVVIV